MRRLHVLVIVLMVLLVVGVGSVAAAPMTVTSSLPFVWIRSAPSSYAAAVYTLYPSYNATVETTGNTTWDSYQTWTEVYLIGNPGVRGWVEQGSLVGASQPVAQPQPQYWASGAPWWGQTQYVVPYVPQPYIPPGYYGNQGWYQPYQGGWDWGEAQG